MGLSLVDGPAPDLGELRTTLFDIAEVTDRAAEMIQGMGATCCGATRRDFPTSTSIR
jgi:hypothetical protein